MIGASTTPISLSTRLGAGSRAFADYRAFRNSSTRSNTNSLSSALLGSRLVENGRLLSPRRQRIAALPAWQAGRLSYALFAEVIFCFTQWSAGAKLNYRNAKRSHRACRRFRA
jgi:hypothetical protein